MKTAALSLLMVIGLMGLNPTAQAAGATKEVMIGVADAYIPGGFDSNSDAYVVVSGIFPNGCYRWSRSDVSTLPENVEEVRTFATVQSGLCIMVLVPFHQEVRLGKLAKGTHQIRFVNGDGTYMEKQLVIE